MAMNKFTHASNRENLAIIQQYFYGQNIHSIQDWYAKGKVSDCDGLISIRKLSNMSEIR